MRGLPLRRLEPGPGRAGRTRRKLALVERPGPARLAEDGITAAHATRDRIPDFAALLTSLEDDERTMRLRRAETIGRPVGSAEFLERLERSYDRRLKPQQPGRRSQEQLSALSP